MYYRYRSVLGKCPWMLYYNCLFFTILGTYPVYWALAYHVPKISGWSEHAIAIVMATQSQSSLASAPVDKAVALSLNTEASYSTNL